MTLDDIHEGMRVLYIPPHAHGERTHPDCQRGIVTSTNATHVFVRYGADRQSNPTVPAWLVPDDDDAPCSWRETPPSCHAVAVCGSVTGRETARSTPLPCLLVIAEDLERRRAWRRLFVHAGYAVMDARDGREGMHYSQTHVIDLVVLDVPLPQGRATLRALRLVAPAMRLLVLVDHDVLGQIDGGRMAQLSGADRVVQLPVADAVLLAAVRALLAMP